ncbi:unnamed protein product [Adineta ricciae]|uniref:Uncharacterized protein n=1 Tax=Adineta ricciae TaxID=249248 RepID=A0A815W6E5_ADIRI|nr:unnamed protein product [Adineta ricciae]CAF1539714.1 unnamed protein product [Adineta ricciae]
MSTQWSPMVEHGFHSNGVSSILSRHYPNVFQLMQEELESVSAYLQTNANMKTIPIQLNINQMDIQEQFERCLGKYLPESAKEHIQKYIYEEIMRAWPGLSSIPAGKSHRIVGRLNDCDRSYGSILFWSCGVDLDLFPIKSTKLFSKCQNYLIDGNLNIALLECHLEKINEIEDLAFRDYQRAKKTIMDAYPRPSLSPLHLQQAIGNQYSPNSETDYTSRQPSLPPETSREIKTLRSTMKQEHNCSVSILNIKELKDSTLSSNDMDALLQSIKSHLGKELNTRNIFIDENQIIIVYSSTSVRNVREKLNGFVDENSRRPSKDFIMKIEHLDQPTYDEVIRKCT